MIKLLQFLFFAPMLVWPSLAAVAQDENIDDDPYVPSVLVVENEDDFNALVDAGVIVWHRRADMVLCAVPKDADVLRHSRSLTLPKRSRPMKPTLDVARTHFDACRINTGTDLPSPYTGRGVVVGFCDSGFDPNHAAFFDSDGRSRVKRLINYDEPKGERVVLDTEEEIRAWTTDDVDMSHATHVCGIMAGSFTGNEYRGLAPDAEIVAATAKLYDAGILSACEDILDYAESVGKPAVINLSLGGYNGPHDGSTLFNRYLSLIGEEAIVCIAAGNEGDDFNTYRITFGDTAPRWRARIHSSDWAQFDMYGMTDIWSADARPAQLKFLIFDENTGVSVYEREIPQLADDEEYIISSQTDSDFAGYMEGKVIIRGGVDDYNGRWRMEMEYDTHTAEPNANSQGNWARYNLAFEVSGDAGVHVDIVSDCQFSRLVQWPGFPAPTADMSVSDIATGDNVICVGMYNNRRNAELLSGDIRELSEPMTVNLGSGYATLIDGRVLPHTVAPGGWLISAASGPYADAHPDAIPGYCAEAEYGGRTHYWDLNAGTSMSTPYVAGAIATWLEADPTLGVNDILEAIKKTNIKEYADPDNPRHGQGWFNPYVGLRSVLGLSSVTPGKIDSAEVRIQIAGDKAIIFNPSGNELFIHVSSLDGRIVCTGAAHGETYSEISVGQLEKGTYILSCRIPGQKVQTVKFLK